MLSDKDLTGEPDVELEDEYEEDELNPPKLFTSMEAKALLTPIQFRSNFLCHLRFSWRVKLFIIFNSTEDYICIP